MRPSLGPGGVDYANIQPNDKFDFLYDWTQPHIPASWKKGQHWRDSSPPIIFVQLMLCNPAPTMKVSWAQRDHFHLAVVHVAILDWPTDKFAFKVPRDPARLRDLIFPCVKL